MLRKKIVEEYLRFSRTDRIGILCLTIMILVIYFLPSWVGPKNSSFPLKPGSALARAIDSLQAAVVPEAAANHERPGGRGIRKTRLFAFDPNRLDKEGWLALGLPEKPANTILHYISKGGRFRKPEDLQKIWGLPAGFYEKVKDSISMAEEIQQAKPAERPINSFPPARARKEYAVDINLSDTAEWIALPGIGATLAGRIISFREKLGGFISIDQVAEVYGLRDSTFRQIRPFLHGGGSVKTLDINTATRDELKQHPYLRWSLANAIVNYREQHGKFTNIDELKNISLIDEKVWERIRPYVVVTKKSP